MIWTLGPKVESCDQLNQYAKTCSEEEPCASCCGHEDIEMDERCCLICGKDLTESLMAHAYDLAKDRRKYGE